MNRVLVTGGAGTVGAAVVRRLLRDPDFEVRVSDQGDIPGWIREGSEVHRGDLRVPEEARRAIGGCSHVIHLAAFAGGPHTRLEAEGAAQAAVIRAVLDEAITRLVLVSSDAVYEREDGIPRSAEGFSALAGEVLCRAAHEEHGLPFTICRPIGVYGPGVPGLVARLLASDGELPLPGPADTRLTLTHLTDVADGIVTAMASPAGLDEDFDLAGEPATLGEVARLCWEGSGREGEPQLAEGDGDGATLLRSAEKAERLLGWRARVGLREGLAA